MMASPRRIALVRRMPWGLIGMLGLVLAAEGYISRNEIRFTPLLSLDWKMTGRKLPQRAASSEVLCFGDSLVKFGVLPQVLERTLGRRAYNFAVYSGSAPASYFLLRRALEAGSRPAAVLVDFECSILADEPQSKGRRFPWMELLDTRESLELSWEARDASLFAQTTLGRAMPSVRDRFEIRNSILAALDGRTSQRDRGNYTCIRNWNQNQGAQVNPKNPSIAPTLGISLQDAENWKWSPVNVAFLRRFLDLAASRDIPVFWLLPPFHPDCETTFQEAGYEARQDEFIGPLAARYKNLVIVDGRHAGYDYTLFLDNAHLDCEGAYAYSSDLAEIVRRQLSGGPEATRWVHVEAVPDRPVGIPLEDLTQSGIALRELGRSLR